MAEDRLVAFARRKRPRFPDVDAFDGDALSTPARRAACLVWQRRAINERASVELAKRLQELSKQAGLLDSRIASAFVRLAEDESFHVNVAVAMLRRLGSPVPADEPILRNPAGSPEIALVREVLTGLVVCETISAARFARVLRATDLPVPRACVALMLRDEVAHGQLGWLVLAPVVALLSAACGATTARDVMSDELRSTFRQLDLVVGLDCDRRGIVPEQRPQPTQNPGVVEPAIDAAAFYEVMHERIVPRLELRSIAARRAWAERFDG